MSDKTLSTTTLNYFWDKVKSYVNDKTAGLKLGMKNMDLLWTNPNPTASFAAQTIALDLSDYDFVGVRCIVSTGIQRRTDIMLCEFDYTTNLCAVVQTMVTRAANAKRTGVAFGIGAEQGGSYNESPNHMIPYQIYGIKNGGIAVHKTVPVELGGTNAQNAKDARANLGCMEMELLWQNASPTSAFPAQTISLDLSEYDGIYIEFIVWISWRTKLMSPYIVKNGATSVVCPGNVLSHRDVAPTDTGVYFSIANAAATYNTLPSTSTAEYCVPYRIYGIKNVN